MADIGDRSYGGAMRSDDLRQALLCCADTRTLVIHGGPHFAFEYAWDADQSRRAIVGASGFGMDALRQRRALRRWVGRAVAESGCNVVVARYPGLAALVPRSARSMLVLDADDIVKTLPPGRSSWLDRLRLHARNLAARRLLESAAHVWHLGANSIGSRSPSRHSVLTNVVRMPPVDRVRAPTVSGRLIMVGYFAHPPNEQGLRWFAAEVLPRLKSRFPHVELHAIGKSVPALQSRPPPGVWLRGFVDDIATAYDEADLVIAPIRWGAGTQIKVIDALAHGRPLVASPFAHGGFAAHLSDRRHLFVADDADHWVEACTSLLERRDEAEAMAARGEAIVRLHYGVDAMARVVETTLATLTKDAPPRRGFHDEPASR